MRSLTLLTLCLFALSSGPVHAERRIALLIGENAGDQTDAPLKYAEADAARMRDVLVRLGGVSETDAILVRGADAAEVRVWLQRLSERFAREGWTKADRLILYVSAHSAAGELHLRGTRFPLSELTAFLDTVPIGVALLVLDTCEAGLAVRSKGLEPLEQEAVQLARPTLTGRVIIASAGSQESAVESDDLGGSLFTHHFVTGLMGAADASHDGLVTLQEAYNYAFSRTVEGAATVRDAHQTPVFEMNLSGEGELVLAELKRGRAWLTFDVEAAGEWVLMSMNAGGSAARFDKSMGRAELALDPGTWRLRSRVRDHYLEDIVTLAEGAHVTVTTADLARWKVVPGGRKGSGPETALVLEGVVSSGAVGGLSILVGGGAEVSHAFDVAPGMGRPLLLGAVSEAIGRPSTQAFLEREFTLVIGGGWEFAFDHLRLRAGARGGIVAVRQEGAPATRLAVEPRLDALAGVSWVFSNGVRVDVVASGGGLLVRTDADRHLWAFGAAGAGVGYAW
ncbi:MAG: caspase family protein [Deltaproteobacteria bacterium]|nr:caspase family protein [Deltaproteobacteria bacterium]